MVGFLVCGGVAVLRDSAVLAESYAGCCNSCGNHCGIPCGILRFLRKSLRDPLWDFAVLAEILAGTLAGQFRVMKPNKDLAELVKECPLQPLLPHQIKSCPYIAAGYVHRFTELPPGNQELPKYPSHVVHIFSPV